MSIRILVLPLLAPLAVAQWHIAPTGSDAGAGTTADPFATIAHAAAVAAPGDTIHLHAGSYADEQGLVTLGAKDLVLQGDGREQTVLHAHSTATVVLDTVDSGPLPHHVGLLISGSARVHVRDLTIDGAEAVGAAGRLVGVWLQGGADCMFDRVTVTGCRPAVLQPTDVAMAVVVHGDAPTDPTTAVWRSCRLQRFAAGGLLARLRADVDLQECDVAGAADELGSPDQFGVWLTASATGRLRHDSLAGLGGTGTAILLQQQGADCAVEGNRIGGTAIGIDLLQSPPMLVPGSVRGNRVASADTALRVRGNRGLAITDNSLFTASSRDPLPVSDDTAGANQWLGNRYAVTPPSGPLPIPGGGSVDPAPQRGCSELGDVERVPVPGAAPLAVQVADFDGDGHTDFATLDANAPPLVTVALTTTTGFAFTSLTFGSTAQLPVAMVVGEFDGQPGRDLAVLVAPQPPATLGGGFFILANDGGGGMTALHFEALAGFTAPSAIAAGNFNANAVDDLVVGDRGALPLTAGAARTLLNDGTGSGWFGTPVPVAITAAVTAVATGDFDGDHKIDVVLAEGSPLSGRVHLLAGTGVGSFAAAAGSPVATPVDPLAVGIADFDDDGDDDVLATAVDGALPLQRGALLLLERRGGSFVPRLLPTDLGPTRVLRADLDADSSGAQTRGELLLLDLAAGNVAIFGAHAAGTGFVGGGLCTGLDQPTDLGVGDFDGDEYPDAIATEPGRGGVAILHGRPTARVDTLGIGCPGSFGRTPRLELRGAPALPLQPNLTLQLGLADAPPFSLAVLAISPLPAPVLTPCGFLLGSVFATYIGVSDVQGRAAWNLPVPALPDLRGLTLCMQAGTLDSAAATSFFPGFGLTALLRVRVGD